MLFQLIYHHILFSLQINISNAEPFHIIALLGRLTSVLLQFNGACDIPVKPNDFLLGGIHQFHSQNIGFSVLEHIRTMLELQKYT